MGHEPGTKLRFMPDCFMLEAAFSVPMDEENSIVAWWRDVWPHRLDPVIIKQHCKMSAVDKQTIKHECKTGRRQVVAFLSPKYKKGTAKQNFQQNRKCHGGKHRDWNKGKN